MVQERPRFGSMAVGVLAGFGAGLLIAALLIAGRADRQMTRPIDAAVASMTATPSSTANPDAFMAPVAQPASQPSEQTPKTITETQTVTKTETLSPLPSLSINSTQPTPDDAGITDTSSSVTPTPQP